MTSLSPSGCPDPHDWTKEFLAQEPPTDAQVERAKRIARERGFLTDDGWAWDHCKGWKWRAFWRGFFGFFYPPLLRGQPHFFTRDFWR